MRRDLPEGFPLSAMAPVFGHGHLMLCTNYGQRERYVSLRLFGKSLFICRGYIAEFNKKYWRWWLQ